MSKHGVWKHATPEELHIQERLGAVLNDVKSKVAQARAALSGLENLARNIEVLQGDLSRSGFDLAERVRERHKNCDQEDGA